MKLWDLASAWVSAPDPTTAIEIAADAVSAVAVTGGDAPAVVGHSRVPLPPGAVVPAAAAANIRDREAAAAAVREALGHLPRRAPRVGLVIPDGAAKVSILRFETVPARRAELDRLIRWKARDAVPFKLDDAQVSWDAAAPVAGAPAFVVVVMRRDIAEEYEALAVAAGTQPGVVTPASFALLNLVTAGEQRSARSGDRLLVHAAAGYSSVAILRGGALALFRNQAGDRATDLTNLVYRTTMYYEDRLGGAGIREVLLASERPEVEDLVRQLATGVAAPVTTLAVPGGPAGGGTVPAASAGLLLGPGLRAA